MKQILRKHDNLILVIIMIILSSSFLLAISLDANDELWNFSNVYKMAKGEQIYKELNVITTPLFFFFGKIMLQTFQSNYLIFRIYNVVIINTCVFYLIYQIFKTLKMRKINAVFFTILFMIVQMIILLNAFYNFLAILFVLLGILCELKIKQDKKYKSIVQGILIFLVFLSKQNIGLFYLLSRILYVFLKEGKETKKQIKYLCIEMISSMICLVLFLLYMYKIDSLYAFLDYTVGGLGEFSYNNLFTSIVGILTVTLELGISMFLIWMAKNRKIPLQESDRNNIILLSITSLFMLGIAYPIFNTAHIFIGSALFIILIIYVMDLLIFKPFFSSEKADKMKKRILILLIVVLLGGNTCFNIYQYYRLKQFSFTKETPYYGVLVEEAKREEIEEIIQYMKTEEQKQKNVIILSYYANLYMNLLDRNNGEMDLPFYGNLGKDGEDGLIEQIKQLKNTKILILTKEDKEYQESQKVMNYIKENYLKEGEIRQFSIYNVE